MWILRDLAIGQAGSLRLQSPTLMSSKKAEDYEELCQKSLILRMSLLVKSLDVAMLSYDKAPTACWEVLCLMLVLPQLASQCLNTHHVQQHGCRICFKIQNIYT